ncbi:HhH-GPD family protein [Dethiosulfovibrio peptidovorans DSM 11002]|uniref:HhH-GPD family protein n=1 Tax=Dethiosulfovibrio peptidovorans DSM 11002 TaxID=469381 RepID=D2Z439_9BACT|nr:endonuclease III [Dethiosulfovibrio peptidovorans]EFC92300.1 HhH-GPD family protein [Dethiosulfovibrio peptidovorans DSM 11002]
MSRLLSEAKDGKFSSTSPLERNLLSVLDVLEELWGQEKNPMVSAFDDPLDGLMLTILSQNTNDNNRDRAFDKLKTLYPLWEDVASVTPDELADAIRVAGIANVKAGRMLDVLKIIHDELGEYGLTGLKYRDHDGVRAFLEGLPGVGPKTAACVLVFDMDIPAFPVDTHVARFCRRMEWVPRSATPVRIQEYMEKIVPDERKKGAHLNIISHGKSICKARKPICQRCPLIDLCPSSETK